MAVVDILLNLTAEFLPANLIAVYEPNSLQKQTCSAVELLMIQYCANR